jgi:hypothetical protein
LDSFFNKHSYAAAPEEEPFEGLRGMPAVDGYTSCRMHNTGNKECARDLANKKLTIVTIADFGR